MPRGDRRPAVDYSVVSEVTDSPEVVAADESLPPVDVKKVYEEASALWLVVSRQLATGRQILTREALGQIFYWYTGVNADLETIAEGMALGVIDESMTEAGRAVEISLQELYNVLPPAGE